MLSKYLIICPLVFLAGFVDAVAGGGGLISLPAYILTGLPVHNCVATNKMSSIMGTSVTTTKYARSGFVPWKIAIFCVPCALIGSAIGANIALIIPDKAFKIILMIVIPVTGLYVLTKKDVFDSNKTHSEGVTTLICALAALIIGVYDGFYGPGTGSFLILILTGLGGLKITTANGLTKVINLSTNLAALTVFLVNGQVVLPLGIIAGCFNIAGNYLGASRFEKNGSKIVKPILIMVLTVFFIKLVLELL